MVYYSLLIISAGLIRTVFHTHEITLPKITIPARKKIVLRPQSYL